MPYLSTRQYFFNIHNYDWPTQDILYYSIIVTKTTGCNMFMMTLHNKHFAHVNKQCALLWIEFSNYIIISCNYCNIINGTYSTCSSRNWNIFQKIISYMMVIVGLLEGIVALISASLSCQTKCCSERSYHVSW